jgi:hypothetical protein
MQSIGAFVAPANDFVELIVLVRYHVSFFAVGLQQM